MPARRSYLVGIIRKSLTLLFCLLISGRALAAGDWEALVREANDLRRAGDDETAHKLLSRAYSQAPNPVTAGQLGLCEFALSRWVESESRLVEALRGASDPWVVKNRATLIGLINEARSHLARVEVSGSPRGAQVEVAGKPVGRFPLSGPVRVVAGPVHVRVSAPGHRAWQQEVSVATGDRRSLVVHLQVDEQEPPWQPPVVSRVSLPEGVAELNGVGGGGGGRVGVFLRLDLAVYPAVGQRLLPGVVYGLSDALDLALAGILGRETKGLWVGGRYALFSGSVRPALSLGIPVVWLDGGARMGAQLGIGALVPLGRHLELALDLTAAGFPGLDAALGRFWILPSAAVLARY
jgi:PEGA domain